MGVDSPLRYLDQGKQEKVKESLKTISYINSKFSHQKPCNFEKVIIYSLEKWSFNNGEWHNSDWDQDQITIIGQKGAFSLFRELCTKHTMVFTLIAII
jgi:hypothetical protein